MTNLLAVVLLSAVGQAQEPTSTAEVAARYIELSFGQQYEALKEVYADDVLFIDPTGDVWSERLANGVRGADSVISLEKSWEITSSSFDIQESFSVGEYALFRGLLTWTTRSSPQVTTDFITIVRVVDGRVAERHDYGNYVTPFGQSMPAAVHDNTRASEEIGRRYFQNYLDREHDAMLASYADSVTFQDPTAAWFGPNSGGFYQGKSGVDAMMRRVFQNISEFDFEVEKAWFSNHHAVFMGKTTFTLVPAATGAPGDITFEHSAVFVVTVADGKVIAHRDYVDYSTFRRQLQAGGG